MTQAMKLSQLAPNMIVKIPVTDAGIPATPKQRSDSMAVTADLGRYSVELLPN